VTATVLLSALAIWGTLRGLGPFGRESPHEALLLLQIFMGGVALLALLVAVVVADRNRVLEQEREARAEADTANRAKDEFLAMLGRELRSAPSPRPSASWI
jgi:signal transduction histidine kinase